MKNGKRQLMSMGLLVLALACLVAFHLMPSFGREQKGWGVWLELLSMFQHRRLWSFEAFVAWASFLNFTFLVAVSPFLKNMWPKSRWIWWSAVIFSGLAALGFWAVMDVATRFRTFGAGGWCLMAAPVLNFLGLLLARPKFSRSRDQIA